MRFFVLLTATLVFFYGTIGDAQKIDYDSGPIEMMAEGKIYVKGNRGNHVLEPLGECVWCEVGLEVLITFKGLTRAELKPYAERGNSKSISVFLIKDGREN